MTGRSRVRQKKQKRRRQRIKHRREHERRHDINVERYPEFIFHRQHTEHVPRPFIQAVERAARSLRFNDRQEFSAEDAQLYSLIKLIGFRPACELLSQGLNEQAQRYLRFRVQMQLGDMLFSKLDQAGALRPYLPFCSVRLVCAQDVHVRFDALLRAKGRHGTIYYSRHRPVIEVDGRPYTVGFSRHAMERVAERTTYAPYSYGGAGDAFAYLANYTRFQPIVLETPHGRQCAVELFERCDPAFLSGSYAEELEGVQVTGDSRLYYRLGYALLSCAGAYAVAVTFLAPGMRGTPEYQAVMDGDLSAGRQRDLLALLESTFTLAGMVEHRDFSALKWVHEHGVPQVVDMQETPFGGEIEERAAAEALLSTVVLGA